MNKKAIIDLDEYFIDFPNKIIGHDQSTSVNSHTHLLSYFEPITSLRRFITERARGLLTNRRFVGLSHPTILPRVRSF